MLSAAAFRRSRRCIRGSVPVLSMHTTGDGLVCTQLPARNGYRVIALAVSRPGERHFSRDVDVHLMARGGRGYVIGVIRR